jgi:hypothetical protein
VKPVLAGIVLLLAATPVRADAGPILPFVERVRAVHRVEAAEEFPDHVFLVFRHGIRSGDGGRDEYNEATREDLAPGRPLVLRPEPHEDVELLIVPRAAFAAFPTPREAASAVFENKVPGASVHRFFDRETIPSWGGPEAVITYQVRRAKSGDGLELVRTSWDPLWQWNAAAISLAAAVALGGFWIIRRMRRKATAAR